MEAKATVTSACRLCSSASNQAEISFKAGKQEGIREVVKWIREHGNMEANYTDDLHMTRRWIELPSGRWQAKLKDWGIEVKDGS